MAIKKSTQVPPGTSITESEEKSRKQPTSGPPPGQDALCPQQLKRFMELRRLNVTELADKTGLSRNTVYKILSGKYLKVSTLTQFAEELDAELDQLRGVGSVSDQEGSFSLTPPRHWRVVEVLSPWMRASNGLQYRLAKLENTTVEFPNFVRGKFYDLLSTAVSKRSELKRFLSRHASVCLQFKRDPHIVTHFATIPLENDDGWWVLDEWLGTISLSSYLDQTEANQLPVDEIRRLGDGILCGLQSLHAAGIIMREMSPDHVLVNDKCQLVLLTEFELAKLGTGAPSVSGTWSPHQFLAPEVSDYDVSPKSDLFGWGQIMLYVLNKHPKIKLPESVADLLSKCTAHDRRQRPQSADIALEEWRLWK
jgi:serine/threonine protein kinase